MVRDTRGLLSAAKRSAAGRVIQRCGLFGAGVSPRMQPKRERQATAMAMPTTAAARHRRGLPLHTTSSEARHAKLWRARNEPTERSALPSGSEAVCKRQADRGTRDAALTAAPQGSGHGHRTCNWCCGSRDATIVPSWRVPHGYVLWEPAPGPVACDHRPRAMQPCR